MGAGRLIVETSRWQRIRHTQPVRILLTSDQLVAEAAIYTTHNKHNAWTSMPSAGFERTIPATQRLQTDASDRTATGIADTKRTQYKLHVPPWPWLISNLMHKILIYLRIIHLLKSSTCFEHYAAHLQEVYVVIVYMQPLVSSLSTGDCLVHRLRKKLFIYI